MRHNLLTSLALAASLVLGGCISIPHEVTIPAFSGRITRPHLPEETPIPYPGVTIFITVYTHESEGAWFALHGTYVVTTYFGSYWTTTDEDGRFSFEEKRFTVKGDWEAGLTFAHPELGIQLSPLNLDTLDEEGENWWLWEKDWLRPRALFNDEIRPLHSCYTISTTSDACMHLCLMFRDESWCRPKEQSQ